MLFVFFIFDSLFAKSALLLQLRVFSVKRWFVAMEIARVENVRVEREDRSRVVTGHIFQHYSRDATFVRIFSIVIVGLLLVLSDKQIIQGSSFSAADFFGFANNNSTFVASLTCFTTTSIYT